MSSCAAARSTVRTASSQAPSANSVRASHACAHSEIRIDPPRKTVGSALSSSARARSGSSSASASQPSAMRMRWPWAPSRTLSGSAAYEARASSTWPVMARPSPPDRGRLDGGGRVRGDEGRRTVGPFDEACPVEPGQRVQHHALADHRPQVRVPGRVREQLPCAAEELGGLVLPPTLNGEIAEHHVAHGTVGRGLDGRNERQRLGQVRRAGERVDTADQPLRALVAVGG